MYNLGAVTPQESLQGHQTAFKHASAA